MASTGKETEEHAKSQPSTPLTFEFVNKDDKSQIRSHAMRESWRQRGRAGIHRPRGRELKLKGNSQHQKNSADTGYSQEPENLSDEASTVMKEIDENADNHVFRRKGIHLDMRHTLATPATTPSRNVKWITSQIHTPDAEEPSPYHSIGDSELDPFINVRLSLEDQELLHHCKLNNPGYCIIGNKFVGAKTYAYEAFGQPTDPTFDPIKDLYIPVDLAYVASVHGILAHSASHLAYLRQERSLSIQAIGHKMNAIRLVNRALNDPMKAISDETFSAVMKLVTYEVGFPSALSFLWRLCVELFLSHRRSSIYLTYASSTNVNVIQRYWGTENAWKLHRNGLVQMIKKRGGLSTFPADWRLEMRIQL